MIVARGLGQSRVLGIIPAFGYGIGGAADVTVEPSRGGGSWSFPEFRRPQRGDDDEVLLMITALLSLGVLE